MAVPAFQSLMLPLLKIIGDGREHNNREVIESLAEQLHLTDTVREELHEEARDL
jgi:restriction system protein